MAATGGGRWGRMAATSSSGAGGTFPVSLAAVFPLARDATHRSRWCTSGGSSSSSTAQRSIRLILWVPLLIDFRARSAAIIASRTFFSARGPNSVAGVVP